jgi:hypothetical protein
MRSTATRWCSAHPDLACQAISRLQVICLWEKYTRARPYLKNLRARSTARLTVKDGEERTEGIFYSAIALLKCMPEALSHPLPELCTRPISRPIVYPDTFRISWACILWAFISWACISWACISWECTLWACMLWACISWACIFWAYISLACILWACISWACILWACISWACIIGVHFLGVHLSSVYLVGMHLTGVCHRYAPYGRVSPGRAHEMHAP